MWLLIMIKFKTVYLQLFALFVILLVSCSPAEKEKKINLCDRFTADQSNLSRDYMSEAEKTERRENRLADFRKNWKLLVGLIESEDLSFHLGDTCYNDFLSATLVHTMQNYPDELLDKNMVDKISVELDKGSISLDYLRLAFSAYRNYTPEDRRCLEMKELVDYALITWRVNDNYEESMIGKIEDIKYVDCRGGK